MTLSILAEKPTLDIQHAKAWARQKGAKRLTEVDRLLETFWKVAPVYGLDPGGLAARSSEETAVWTSPIWQSRLVADGLGVEDVSDQGLSFADGEAAAWADVVHTLVYARPTVLQRVPKERLRLDPRLANVFYAGYAGTAKTYDDLAGKWASDVNYGKNVLQHWTWIKNAIVTPKPTPQPTPGGAPLPANIVQVATGNRNPRTNGQQPIAIVYHITDDMDFAGTKAWFQNPASQASAQVVIDRDGTIYQFVSSTETAWTNNDVKRPRTDIDWLTKAIAVNWIHGGPYSMNDFTLSIEHVGTPENPPTEAQYRSSIALSKYWRDRYHIKPNRGHLLRHADINSVDRSYCPGPRFDLARVIRELGGDPADMSS